jgi:hypothetical protein
MKTNFNSLLDQLDNGLSSKSFTFGIIIIIMSGVAMLSNIIVLIVINKFKKKDVKKDKKETEQKTLEVQKTEPAGQEKESIVGLRDITVEVK